MQGTNELKILLDEVASRTLVNRGFKTRLELLSPAGRAEDFKRIAEELEIEPEIVDNFDLAGIEAETIQGFFKEVQFRFFEEDSLSPER